MEDYSKKGYLKKDLSDNRLFLNNLLPNILHLLKLNYDENIYNKQILKHKN